MKAINKKAVKECLGVLGGSSLINSCEESNFFGLSDDEICNELSSLIVMNVLSREQRVQAFCDIEKIKNTKTLIDNTLDVLEDKISYKNKMSGKNAFRRFLETPFFIMGFNTNRGLIKIIRKIDF